METREENKEPPPVAATDVYHLLLQDMARYAADASAPNEVLLTPLAFITQEYGE